MEILGGILAICVFGGFVFVLFLGALALDGGFDTWLMGCRECKKAFLAEQKNINTVYINCVNCNSKNTIHLSDVSTSHEITTEDEEFFKDYMRRGHIVLQESRIGRWKNPNQRKVKNLIHQGN